MSNDIKIEVPLSKLKEMQEKLMMSTKPVVEFSEDYEKMRKAAFTEMRQRAFEALFIVDALLKRQ